jgi:DivIVA domain-containing protein
MWVGEVMPLTPEDVSNKRFTPVRLREGYDMGEVDQFLDEVESELARLIKENDDLRERLGAGEESPVDAPFAAYRAQAEPEPEHGAEPEAARVAQVQEIKVATVSQASSAAARLLEIATQNADQLVGEARAEADQILADARTNAERLEQESKTKSDQLEADARTRSQMLDSETAERRTQLFSDLEKEQGRLKTEVEDLRAFEREYRSRLKSYFSQQLAALENNESSSTESNAAASLEGSGDPAPKRLRALLGEDEA